MTLEIDQDLLLNLGVYSNERCWPWHYHKQNKPVYVVRFWQHFQALNLIDLYLAQQNCMYLHVICLLLVYCHAYLRNIFYKMLRIYFLIFFRFFSTFDTIHFSYNRHEIENKGAFVYFLQTLLNIYDAISPNKAANDINISFRDNWRYVNNVLVIICWKSKILTKL